MGVVGPGRWLAVTVLVLAGVLALGGAAGAEVYRCLSYDETWYYGGDNAKYDGYVDLTSNQVYGNSMSPNSCWDSTSDSWGFGFALKNVTADTLGAAASINWVGLTMKFYDSGNTMVHSLYIPGSQFGGWFDEDFQDLSHGPHVDDPLWLDPNDLCAACFCTHFGSSIPGYISMSWDYLIYVYVNTTYPMVENDFTFSEAGVGKWYKISVPSGLSKVRFLVYAYSGDISGWANQATRFYKVSDAQFSIGTSSSGTWAYSDWYNPSGGYYYYVYVADQGYGGVDAGGDQVVVPSAGTGESGNGDYIIAPSAGTGQVKVQFFCDTHGSAACIMPVDFGFSVPPSTDGVTPGTAHYSIYVPSGGNYLDVDVATSVDHSFYLTSPSGVIYPVNQGTVSGSPEVGCWKLVMENMDQSMGWYGSAGEQVAVLSSKSSSGEQIEADNSNSGTWVTSIDLSPSQ